MNGDLLTDFPVGDLLDAHRARGFAATVAVSRYSHQVPFGVVQARDGGLVDIVEKPVSSWPVNAGVYALEPRLLDRIPRGQLFPITALLDDCRRCGERVGVWQLPGDWLDIGRPAELRPGAGDLVSGWPDRQVLVTGADGFIGSHLVERLLAEDARVRAFCLYNSGGSLRLAGRAGRRTGAEPAGRASRRHPRRPRRPDRRWTGWTSSSTSPRSSPSRTPTWRHSPTWRPTWSAR